MKFYSILFFCFFNAILYSQERERNKENDLQISLAYGIHSNSFNEDRYFDYKSTKYTDIGALNSITLKFTLPTKRDYLDMFFGIIFDYDRSTLSSSSWQPGNTNASDHYMNGGGIFAGLSPKWKGKHIGLTSEIGIGVFSFKEVYSHFNNRDEPYVDIHEKKTTYGLGAMGSVGFYIKFGWIGINPNVNMLFTGGDDASFLLYGVSLPLTIYL